MRTQELNTQELVNSLRKTGGATQFVAADIDATTGFMVGRSDLVPSQTFKTDISGCGTSVHRNATATAWAAARALAIETGKGFAVGWWHDLQGTLWIDVSERIEDREEALKLAASLGELAIFDLATGDAIEVR